MARYSSNATARFGAPISALLRGTTSLEYESNSNGEDVITTTEVGSTKSIAIGSFSMTTVLKKGSPEAKKLVQAHQNSAETEVFLQMGELVFHCRGTFKSLKASSATNKAIEFSYTFSGEDLPVQDA